jgi:mRNA interferase MazF
LPITSNVTKIYPFEVFISKEQSGLTKDSKLQCHQIRTISKKRLVGDVIAKVDNNVLRDIEFAVKLHLDFS